MEPKINLEQGIEQMIKRLRSQFSAQRAPRALHQVDDSKRGEERHHSGWRFGRSSRDLDGAGLVRLSPEIQRSGNLVQLMKISVLGRLRGHGFSGVLVGGRPSGSGR